MARSHGMDFSSIDDKVFATKSHPGLSLDEYVVWLAEFSGALRVWVDTKMVWSYEKGWLVPMLDLQKTICRIKHLRYLKP